MKRGVKTYLAAVFAFCLGLSVSLGFMMADFGTEDQTGVGMACSSAGKRPCPAVVIDAGHGGFDGGAQAADGTEEKQINLEIARRIAGLAEDYHVTVILTRDGDGGLYEEDSSRKKTEDLKRRKEIMKNSGAELAISIHLNSYPQDTSVYGAQIFYSPDEHPRTSSGISSKEIAVYVQNALETAISDGRERAAMEKNDVLLLQNPPCPVILAECGFLSNPDEAEKLKTAEYQQLLAESIWKSVAEILCIEKKENIPVIYSTNKP